MIAPSVSLVPVGGSSRAIRTAGGVFCSNYLVLLSILGVGHPVRCSERMTVGPLRAVAPCIIRYGRKFRHDQAVLWSRKRNRSDSRC